MPPANHRTGATLWFTGLSGSGKTTITRALEAALQARGIPCYRLDGDLLRSGLCADLGFSREDRRENIRRAGEAARLLSNAGLITLAAFISPYRADRARIREIHAAAGLPFFEVHVSTPLAVCEQRDAKGLYRRARAGDIPGFTGVSDPYEPPESPDLVIPAGEEDVGESVERCLGFLAAAGLFGVRDRTPR